MRAGEDLSDYLVQPLILNVGKLRLGDIRDLSEVIYIECVNAALSTLPTKPRFLMMMQKMTLRIARVLWKLTSLLGLQTGDTVLLCLSQVYIWDKNQLCSGHLGGQVS